MNNKNHIKVFLLLLLLCFSFSCDPRELPIARDLVKKSEDSTTEQTEKAIAESPELQKLNSVCNSFPRPKDFKFTWKGGLDDEVLALSFYYYSETDFNEAKRFFISSIEENNVKFIKETDSYPKSVEFVKENYSITIFNGGMGSRSNYSIHCEKLN